MKQILLHLYGSDRKNIFNANARDQISQPFFYLRDRLDSLGYKLEQASTQSLDTCEWVFFFDFMSVFPYTSVRGRIRRLAAAVKGKPIERPLFQECQQAGMGDRMALFLWEGPVVQPLNWKPSLRTRFPHIFTWNNQLAEAEPNVHQIHWPQPSTFPDVSTVPFAEKKLLINISMNKHSFYPRSLYNERLRTINYFQKHFGSDFDLFGYGWDSPITFRDRFFPSTWRSYPAYRGKVANKWEVMTDYRFAICYENLRDEPGYITEKIFDSMRSGCVPIYWGAPNICDYVDEDAFIDRRRFASQGELAEYLVNMTETEYNHYQEAMQDYLASDRFARFLPAAFADTIINALEL